MTVAAKQQQLIADYAIIEDRQERLAAVVAHARQTPPLPAAERTDTHRVRGCMSPVWLVGGLEDDRLRLRYDAESPLVRGLVGLLVELYDGALPADAAATEPVILEELGLQRDLSPTRQNGLSAVRRRIRELATQLQPGLPRTA
ncbi:MAG TPA: SufE family protein [Opitutaceae bacterium]